MPNNKSNAEGLELAVDEDHAPRKEDLTTRNSIEYEASRETNHAILLEMNQESLVASEASLAIKLKKRPDLRLEANQEIDRAAVDLVLHCPAPGLPLETSQEMVRVTIDPVRPDPAAGRAACRVPIKAVIIIEKTQHPFLRDPDEGAVVVALQATLLRWSFKRTTD